MVTLITAISAQRSSAHVEERDMWGRDARIPKPVSAGVENVTTAITFSRQNNADSRLHTS